MKLFTMAHKGGQGNLKTFFGYLLPYFLAISLTIPGKGANAQPQVSVDSLHHLFAHPYPDTVRISAILSMSYSLLEDAPAFLQYHFWLDSLCRAQLNTPSGLSEKDKKYYTRSLGFSLELQGYYYQRKAWNAEKALQYHEASMIYSQAAGDLATTAHALNNIANIYQDRGLIPTALEYYLKAREVWEQLSDKTGLAICLDDIGKMYTNQGNLPKAKEFTLLALQECQKANILGTEAMALMHLGNIYTLEGDFPAAETCLTRSLQLGEQIEDDLLITLACRYWGILLEAEGATQKALDIHHRGLALAKKMNYNKGASLSHLYISKLQYGQRRLTDALFHANQSLQYAEQTGIVLNIKEAAEFLGKLYETSGDPAQALQYFRYSTVMKDSLFNEKNRWSMIGQQIQYDYDKKEAIALREKKVQQIILIAFAILLFLTAIYAALVFRNLRIKERQNKIIEQQNQELEKRNRQIVENSRVIQAQSEKLQRLDEIKSRFFTNISHEFRTPLTLVLGPLDDLIAGKEKGNVLPYYHMIRRNTQRLLHLINQLLDLSQLEHSEMKLEIRCEDMVGFLRNNFFAFESLAHQYRIRLQFKTVPETALLYFDRHKMEQVIANLLSNALKFTPEGGEISLTVAMDEAFLKIEVADSGQGIPADQLPYVFDRFYQGSAAGRKGSQGSGIGLALTKELIELHHGRIEVESEVDTGTQFSIFLPMGANHFRPEEIVEKPTDQELAEEVPVMVPGFMEANDLISPPFQESSTQDLLPGSKEAMDEAIILLVEDNADMRAFIRKQLDDIYRVIEAANGREGMEKAFEFTPDLIISDVMMPEMDGLQLCQILKNDQRTSHIPFVLLTAKVDVTSRLDGFQRGADAYLAKPFNQAELMIRVKKMIELRLQLQQYYSKVERPTTAPDEQSRPENDFLKKIWKAVESELDSDNFNVAQLCLTLNMSQPQLYRKVKSLTGISIAAYIRKIRLSHAKKMLRDSDLTISEIAYTVGFKDPSYFSRTFSEEYGSAPINFR